MKKKLMLVLIALIAVPFLMQAQESRPFRVGVTFGGNMNFFAPKGNETDGKGLTLTIFPSFYVDFLLTKNVYLSTGLRYDVKGGKISYPQVKVENPDGVDNHVTDKFRINSLEFPILVKVFSNQFGNWIFHGGTGLVPGFRLSASVEHEYTRYRHRNPGSTSLIEGTYTVEEGITKQVSFFDLAAVIQVGFDYKLADRTALTMGLYSDFGFLNVLKDLDANSTISPNAKTRQIGIYVGLIF